LCAQIPHPVEPMPLKKRRGSLRSNGLGRRKRRKSEVQVIGINLPGAG